MRLLANENFPGDAVEALRARGHDVVWIRTESAGLSDPDVLDRAVKENRILVTFDKDFGALAFRARPPVVAGIVLFRISPRSSTFVRDLAVSVLESRADWANHFSVVEESRVRMTPLPPQYG